MLYYLTLSFDTAEALQQKIVNNALNALKAANPDAVADGLVGRNAGTGSLDPSKAKTTRWAEPRETATGKWAVPVPTQEKFTNPYGMVPIDLVKSGITHKEHPEPEWAPALEVF